MSNFEEPNPDFVAAARAPRPSDDHRIEKNDLAEIERAHSVDPGLDKSQHQRYDKVDKELAKYINDEAMEISDAENSRLRRMIDKRVLVIMIATYFIQAIDKVSKPHIHFATPHRQNWRSCWISYLSFAISSTIFLPSSLLSGSSSHLETDLKTSSMIPVLPLVTPLLSCDLGLRVED
ncbi:hypothetical protein CONLIGDRAFT_318356 [Coniochaeta ligniaria NRRL 30616]|uniref:Uncharacterized protein n=1 Tax=Coniochaeta ligniaria NRRL 30616 TaxID=1408157 RepID=A0A1J7JUM1_9PEZI|nr:hypothetical protein CONLIGDRAFT_318356 [Coniochaeta ligniaria NRRL 30616]